MSRIGIITDSHSSITQDEADRLGIKYYLCHFILVESVIMRGKI